MAAEEAQTGLVFHPMDQFIVKPLFGGDAIYWYTPTNVTLWMGLTVLAVALLLSSAPGGARLCQPGCSRSRKWAMALSIR